MASAACAILRATGAPRLRASSAGGSKRSAIARPVGRSSARGTTRLTGRQGSATAPPIGSPVIAMESVGPPWQRRQKDDIACRNAVSSAMQPIAGRARWAGLGTVPPVERHSFGLDRRGRASGPSTSVRPAADRGSIVLRDLAHVPAWPSGPAGAEPGPPAAFATTCFSVAASWRGASTSSVVAAGAEELWRLGTRPGVAMSPQASAPRPHRSLTRALIAQRQAEGEPPHPRRGRDRSRRCRQPASSQPASSRTPAPAGSPRPGSAARRSRRGRGCRPDRNEAERRVRSPSSSRSQDRGVAAPGLLCTPRVAARQPVHAAGKLHRACATAPPFGADPPFLRPVRSGDAPGVRRSRPAPPAASGRPGWPPPSPRPRYPR